MYKRVVLSAVLLVTALLIQHPTTMAETGMGKACQWYTLTETENLKIGDEVTIFVKVDGYTFDRLDLFTVGPTAGGKPAFEIASNIQWYGRDEICPLCWARFDVSDNGSSVLLWYTIRVTKQFPRQQHFGVVRVYTDEPFVCGLIPQLDFSYKNSAYLPLIAR